MWRIIKIMTECARIAVMLDGEIFKYVDISQGVAQGCTLSPNICKLCICINYMIVAVEAAKARSHDEGKYGVGVDVCG